MDVFEIKSHWANGPFRYFKSHWANGPFRYQRSVGKWAFAIWKSLGKWTFSIWKANRQIDLFDIKSHWANGPFRYQKSLGKWTIMCLFLLLPWLKPFPQTEHVYGFSPVWERMWIRRLPGVVSILPHKEHIFNFAASVRVCAAGPVTHNVSKCYR